MRGLNAFRPSSCLRRTNTDPEAEAHRRILRLQRTHHVVLVLLVLGSSTASLPIAVARIPILRIVVFFSRHHLCSFTKT